jgi:hypothetical protein
MSDSAAAKFVDVAQFGHSAAERLGTLLQETSQNYNNFANMPRTNAGE